MYWGLRRHRALHGVEHKQLDSGRKPNRHCSQSFSRGAIHVKIMVVSWRNGRPRSTVRGKRTRSRRPAHSALDRGNTTPHSRVARQPGMQGMGDVADRGQPRGDRPGETCSSARGIVDVERKRVRSDKLFLIGRMASPHWYCRTRDRFEMIRAE